jgi:hypothetical protein
MHEYYYLFCVFCAVINGVHCITGAAFIAVFPFGPLMSSGETVAVAGAINYSLPEAFRLPPKCLVRLDVH